MIRFSIVLVIFLIAISFLYSQDTLIRWEPEVNLTQDTVYNLSPWIECKDNYVHIVWEKLDRAVCYQRSTDGGSEWSSPIVLNDIINCTHPKLRLWSDVVHCVWVEVWESPPYGYRVMYRHSNDNGETWEPPIHIGPSYSGSSFAVKEETLLVIVNIGDSVPPDPPGIYCYRSFDNGITWSDPCFIRDDLTLGGDPDMLVYGDSVIVAFQYSPASAVLYMVTTDWGDTWTDTTHVSTMGAVAPKAPKICKNAFSHLIFAWPDNRYSGGFLDDIVFRRSTDGGITWLPEQQITDHHLVDNYVDIACADSDVYLVWPKFSPDGLQFRASTDMGETWWQIEDICNNLVFDGTVAADSSKIHVAWRDRRVYPSEIYYRRGTRLPVDIKERKITSSKTLTNIRAFPNPFSTFTTITLNISSAQVNRSTRAQDETIELKVYNMSGRLVKDFSLPTNHSALSTAVSWGGKDKNGSLLPAGIYFCKIKAGRKTYIKKLIKLR